MEEIKIRDFPASNKKPGPDGVDGEIVDCIICLVALHSFRDVLIDDCFIVDSNRAQSRFDLYVIETTYKKIIFSTAKTNFIGLELRWLIEKYCAGYRGSDIISHIHKKLDKWESQCAS